MSSVKIIHTTMVVTLMLAMVLIAVEPNQAEPDQAFFVFGDSLVDSGNNNYLGTTARADSPPYGIDYPTHQPTGRFSNGFNLPDLICEALGIEPPLSYLNPGIDGPQFLNGANFASAGIGILDDTGVQFIGILRMFRQFELFQHYQQRLSMLIGEDRARKLVDSAIVLITVGGNDFVNNYFVPPRSIRMTQFTIPQFCQFLVSEYRKILMRLYELGARTVLVTGVGPLGCVPGELALLGSENGECVRGPQLASMTYNPLLFRMLKDLNKELGSDVFIAANAFAKNLDLINYPEKFGFASSKLACCGQGPYKGIGTCTPLSHLCPDRDLYVFWDAFHPTEKANRIIVQQLMHGSSKYMYPMNLSTIMALDSTKN